MLNWLKRFSTASPLFFFAWAENILISLRRPRETEHSKINYELAFHELHMGQNTLKCFDFVRTCATTYLDVNSWHREDLKRRIFLGREAEKLSFAFVPLHRVESVAFQIILADQIHVVATLDRRRHQNLHVLQRQRKVWKMRKVLRDVRC